MLRGISDTVNARAFKPLPLCSALPENWLVGISGALKMKESHFLSKNMFWENAEGISDTVNARAFKHLPLCSAPLKTD